MENYHSFDFLKKIYFVRTGGSNEELKAAQLIQKEIEKLGGSSVLESFEVDASNVKVAKLSFTKPNIEIECAGCGYTGSTSIKGITGKFIYIDSDESLKMNNLEGKIILLIKKRVPHKYYVKAINEKAKGFILVTGNVYSENKDVELDPYLGRDVDYSLGFIPTVMIRAKDAERVVEMMPEEATIVLQSDDFKRNSHNVISEIKGSKRENEVIVFTAHYDSVSSSKGPYDNGSGTITLLQLYNHFMINKPERTVKFIWCGSEEMGLLGSKNFVKTHKTEVNEKVIFGVNVDMVAVTLGFDYCAVTGEEKIVSYIKDLSKEVQFPIAVKQQVYSSDSTPFADEGVPMVTFARLSGEQGAKIHCNKDVIERLSEPNYMRTCAFIENFLDKIVNQESFPFEKIMPENMKNELDIYLCRKEKEEK